MEQDIDVRDVIDDNGLTIVYAEPDQFAQVQDALREAGVEEFKVESLKCYHKLILSCLKRIKLLLKN